MIHLVLVLMLVRHQWCFTIRQLFTTATCRVITAIRLLCHINITTMDVAITAGDGATNGMSITAGVTRSMSITVGVMDAENMTDGIMVAGITTMMIN